MQKSEQFLAKVICRLYGSTCAVLHTSTGGHIYVYAVTRWRHCRTMFAVQTLPEVTSSPFCSSSSTCLATNSSRSCRRPLGGIVRTAEAEIDATSAWRSN